MIAIERTSCQAQPEITIVANDSVDGGQAMIDAQHPEIHLDCNSNNVGSARASNIRMSKADGGDVLLLNSDTEVKDNALDQVITLVATHSTARIVGAYVPNADGIDQHNSDFFPARPPAITARRLIGAFALCPGSNMTPVHSPGP